MLATATITYDLSDYGLADFDSRRTKVWATNNVNGPVVDTEGNLIHLGSANGTVNADGTGSITVPTPGAGSNPASWQTTIHVDYPDRNADRGRGRLTLGPFTITASGDLADLVDEQAIPPDFSGSGFIAEVGAIRDSQVDISGISTSDGVVEALVRNTAGAGPLTTAALSDVIATEVETGYGQPIDTTRRGGVRVEAITLTGPDFGTSGVDITGYQRNATISGDFSAMGGPSPGQVFGNNDFTVLDDTTGATSVYGTLAEVAVTATAGTIANVYGSFSEVSLFGAAAGATIDNAISHRVGSPKRKDGATGGSIGNAISLYAENPGSIGSSGNYAAWLDGNSRIVGRLELGDHIVSTSGTMRLRGDYTTGSYVEVASVASGGNLTAKLGTASSIFAINNHDGSGGGVVFYVDNAGNAYIKTSTGLKNIVIGAADSGGSGFRTLTVAN